MAWLQIDAGFRDHPKVLKLARDCNMSVAHACGTLTSLWLWTLIHAPDGDLSSYDSEDIELAAGWGGEAGVWYKSAVARRLLDETEHGAQVHDWQDHTSSWKEAQRARDYRKEKRKRSARVRDNAALSHDSAPDRPTEPTEPTDRKTDRQKDRPSGTVARAKGNGSGRPACGASEETPSASQWELAREAVRSAFGHDAGIDNAMNDIATSLIASAPARADEAAGQILQLVKDTGAKSKGKPAAYFMGGLKRKFGCVR
jgi:hypothetical protein